MGGTGRTGEERGELSASFKYFWEFKICKLVRPEKNTIHLVFTIFNIIELSYSS